MSSNPESKSKCYFYAFYTFESLIPRLKLSSLHFIVRAHAPTTAWASSNIIKNRDSRFFFIVLEFFFSQVKVQKCIQFGYCSLIWNSAKISYQPSFCAINLGSIWRHWEVPGTSQRLIRRCSRDVPRIVTVIKKFICDNYKTISEQNTLL